MSEFTEYFIVQLKFKNLGHMKSLRSLYRCCWSHFPIHGQQIEGLLQTKEKVMAASECLVQEEDGRAGSGCCHGCLSRTCVQRAQGASWSLNLCTLLKGDREQSLSLAGKQKVNL